jgi:hypothetical protein
MPACDAYIPEGTLRPSPGGRVVTPPGIAARLIGCVGRRCGGQRLAGRRRERARVLAESAQGTASA